jgi:hypothetical protein
MFEKRVKINVCNVNKKCLFGIHYVHEKSMKYFLQNFAPF